MVVLLDSDGNELAACIAQSTADPHRLFISRVLRGKGKLLGHYYAQGLRSVQVLSESFVLRGVLETSWLGAERQWVIRLTPISIQSGSRHGMLAE